MRERPSTINNSERSAQFVRKIQVGEFEVRFHEPVVVGVKQTGEKEYEAVLAREAEVAEPSRAKGKTPEEAAATLVREVILEKIGQEPTPSLLRTLGGFLLLSSIENTNEKRPLLGGSGKLYRAMNPDNGDHRD